MADSHRMTNNVSGNQTTIGGHVLGPVYSGTVIQQAPATPALHQLRAPVGDFVGRAAEIAELAAAIRTTAAGGAAAISGLQGMGGVGKTELALRVAQELTPDFPDAQLLLALGGAGPLPLTPAQALQAAIRAFERESKLPEDAAELQGIYTSLLSGKRALILADDAKEAAQVRALLPPPGCALLVTSRSRFSLPGMRALDLGALPVPEATSLLLAICPRIDADAAVLAALCGQLPLALRVSASLLRDNPGRPVARYLAQLREERLAHLEDPDGDPDDPQASVTTSIALSFVALPTEARTALAALSVFASDFDQAAALAVLDMGAEAEPALELLVRRSLLDLRGERYALHDLVRAFGTRHLADPEAVHLRHAHHYLAVAEQSQERYLQGGDALLAGLALFDQERTQIDAGWAWALARAGQPEADQLLLDYADAVYSFASLRYDLRRSRISQLEAQRAAAQRLGRRDHEGNALGNLGTAYADMGETHTAIGYYEQHLEIARAIGDRRGEGHALCNLGIASYALGEARTAIGYFEQHLEIARAIDDRRGAGTALGGLGTASYALGEARTAIGYFEQWVAIARAIGDRHGEGHALGNLGIAHWSLGDAHTAIGSYEQQLDLTRAIGDRAGEVRASWNLGLIYAQQGNLARAIELLQVYVDFLRELGHPDAEPRAAYVAELHQRTEHGEGGGSQR